MVNATAHHECQSRHLVEFLIPKIPGEEYTGRSLERSCWGEIVRKKFASRGSSDASKIRTLASQIGIVFEQVVVQLVMSYNLTFAGRALSPKKVASAIDFFMSPYDRVPLEQNNDSSPLCRITTTIFELGGTSQARVILAKKLLHLVFAQHVFDPPQFVSHGFDHSLNVAHYCVNIAKNPLIREKFTTKYKLTDKNISQLNPLIQLLGYLHDCGYPYLQGREKTNHSVFGADKIDDLREAFEGVIGKGSGFDTIYSDFREAVFYHNADDIEYHYDSRIITSSGSFLLDQTSQDRVEKIFSQQEQGLRPSREFNGSWHGVQGSSGKFPCRHLDLLFPQDHMLGLEKVEVLLDNNPFHIIRIADNLDIARSRMTELQKSDEFSRLCRAKYLIDKKEKQKKLLSAQEQLLLETEILDLKEECRLIILTKKLEDVYAEINEKSFKHFGGCMSVERVDRISLDNDITTGGMKMVVEVTVKPHIWEDLNKQDYSFEEKNVSVTIARYQMFRAYKALESVYINHPWNPLANGLIFKIHCEGQEDKEYSPLRVRGGI